MKLKKSIAISESGFIFNANRGESFSTNSIGTKILGLFQEGKDQDSIKNILLEEYEIDNATCEKDLYDFVKMLVQYNLVE